MTYWSKSGTAVPGETQASEGKETFCLGFSSHRCLYRESVLWRQDSKEVGAREARCGLVVS
jgi:hypothetical protein